jgi:hypothetical protein
MLMEVQMKRLVLEPSRHSAPSRLPKRAQSAQVASDVAAYLAAGGEIRTCAYGESGYRPISERADLTQARVNAARARRARAGAQRAIARGKRARARD